MIKTSVARIFGPRNVALSAGAIDGVKEGMVFVIYSLGDSIFDPITGEPLGELELVKGRVKVVNVQERVCQATTLSRSVTETVDPMRHILPDLGFQKREVTRTVYDELKVDNPQPLTIDLTVRVGDFARSVD
jgi:hypothetical protein